MMSNEDTMVLCVECEHCNRKTHCHELWECEYPSPEPEKKDPVDGLPKPRYCKRINTEGKCSWFSPLKSQPKKKTVVETMTDKPKPKALSDMELTRIQRHGYVGGSITRRHAERLLETIEVLKSRAAELEQGLNDAKASFIATHRFYSCLMKKDSDGNLYSQSCLEHNQGIEEKLNTGKGND